MAVDGKQACHKRETNVKGPSSHTGRVTAAAGSIELSHRQLRYARAPSVKLKTASRVAAVGRVSTKARLNRPRLHLRAR